MYYLYQESILARLAFYKRQLSVHSRRRNLKDTRRRPEVSMEPILCYSLEDPIGFSVLCGYCLYMQRLKFLDNPDILEATVDRLIAEKRADPGERDELLADPHFTAEIVTAHKKLFALPCSRGKGWYLSFQAIDRHYDRFHPSPSEDKLSPLYAKVMSLRLCNFNETATL